jgi:protocatechuate 3,4-dioxygenase beta subunit
MKPMNSIDRLLREAHLSKDGARRAFLKKAFAGSAALFTLSGAYAELLSRTPSQTEGPYYPDKFPLDTDNDLIVLNDRLTPGIGVVTYLSGRVTDLKGNPVKNATVEIWQCDAEGSYIHSNGSNPSTRKRDTNFQGFGRFLTSANGEYFFRTIKPVPYPGRTPHIHVIVKKGDQRLLTTQCYISGHELNRNDGVLRSISDPIVRELCMVEWLPIPDSTAGEYSARFDIVVGQTPEA